MVIIQEQQQTRRASKKLLFSSLSLAMTQIHRSRSRAIGSERLTYLISHFHHVHREGERSKNSFAAVARAWLYKHVKIQIAHTRTSSMTSRIRL